MPPKRDEQDPERWETYRRLVLDTQSKLADEQHDLNARVMVLEASVAFQGGRRAVWAFIGGLLGSGLVTASIRYFVH